MSADLIGQFGKSVVVTRYEASRQTQKLEFDSDFVEDNSVNLDVDGEAIPEISFDTDHDTTMIALAASIQAMEPIQIAEVTAAREITITAEHEGVDLLISGIIVTGGVSEPTGSITAMAGGYIDGVYQPGPITTFDAVMSIQPLSGKELLLLPEGERTRRYVKGYTATELKTASHAESRMADRVADGDVEYEVQNIETWGSALSHFKVIMAEVNQ